ncbi:MAG: hypothetical protein AMJ90_06240, partial [candidate division Zixibacteria bacterium SM23_73_2]
MRKVFLITLLVLFFSANSYTRELNLSFFQDNLTYTWQERFNYKKAFNQKTSLEIKSRGNSVMIKSSGKDTSKRWQESGDVDLKLTYNANEKLSWGGFLLYDVSSLEGRDVHTQNLGVFADYKIFSQVKLFQSLGFKGFQRKFGGERKPDEGYDHLF